MSTEKHDAMMDQQVSMSIAELAALAHEAYELQAGTVVEADAHRYTRDSLRSSNEARAVLVDELHRLDGELTIERSAFGVMEQTALTLRAQLDVERAKHQRATRHIANMVTGQGWPEGRPNTWTLTIAQARHNVEAELAELRAEVARLTEGLANAHAAQGIVPLRFEVGDYVTLTEAHNDGVAGRQYGISEAKADSSLPYYLGDDAGWVPEGAVAEYVPGRDPEPEARPFKVGDRVEMADQTPWSETGRRGVVREDDGFDSTCWVQWDDREANKSTSPTGLSSRGECVSTSDLRRIEWEPGERIEVGVEVEYVNGRGATFSTSKIGQRGKVVEFSDNGSSAIIEGCPGNAMLYNLRRVS